MITVIFPAFFVWLLAPLLILVAANEILKIYLWFLRRKLDRAKAGRK